MAYSSSARDKPSGSFDYAPIIFVRDDSSRRCAQDVRAEGYVAATSLSGYQKLRAKDLRTKG